MIARLINTSYIYDTLAGKIWRYTFIGWGILLVLLTGLSNNILTDNGSVILYISSFFVFTSFLVVLLNSTIIKEVGTADFQENRIVLSRPSYDTVLYFDRLNSIKYSKDSKGHYRLQMPHHDDVIEVSSDKIEEIQKLLGQHGISLVSDNLFDWLKQKRKINTA
jgi:hypothetical protein